jgi:hypothetical protein
MNTRRSVAILAGLAIALTGCANGDSTTTNDQKSGSGQSKKSPLEEYLGNSPLGGFSKGAGPAVAMKIGGGDSESEEGRAQQRQAEDLIAKCMLKEGFSYVPVQPDTGGKSKIDQAYELPPDKFAEQYGYGITTLGFVQDPNGGDADSDPNREIRDKLSEQAKKAYDKALNGSGGEVVAGSDGGGVIQRRTGDKGGENSDSGCRGKAMDQVFGRPDKNEMGNQMEKFQGLFDDIEALRKRIDGDPRLEKATKAWSDCMADKSYRFTKPEEAPQSVSRRLERLFGLSNGPGSSSSTTELKKPDPKEVAKIKPYELAVAKADYKCREQHYNKTYQTVQFELESAFVKDHKAELEAYRDWMSELQSPQATPTRGSK